MLLKLRFIRPPYSDLGPSLPLRLYNLRNLTRVSKKNLHGRAPPFRNLSKSRATADKFYLSLTQVSRRTTRRALKPRGGRALYLFGFAAITLRYCYTRTVLLRAVNVPGGSVELLSKSLFFFLLFCLFRFFFFGNNQFFSIPKSQLIRSFRCRA